MFCTNCGKQLKEHSNFCIYCGKKVDSNVEKVQKSKSNRYRMTFILVIIIGIIIWVLFGIKMLWPQNSTAEVTETNESNDVEASFPQIVENESIIETQNVTQELSETQESESASAVIEVENQKKQAQIKREVKETLFDVEDSMAGSEFTEYDENGNVIHVGYDSFEWNVTYEFYENGMPSVQYWYNSEGTLTSEKHFDEMGNITRDINVEVGEEYSYTYEYNEQGKITKQVIYWAQGKEETRFEKCETFEYDELSNPIVQAVYYDESLQSPAFEYHWEYDENGEVILYYMSYPSDNSIGYKSEYDVTLNVENLYYDNGYGDLYCAGHLEYDKKDNLLFAQYFDEMGEVTMTKQYEYTYDDYGNVVEGLGYYNGELCVVIKKEYY